ncbi:MAG: hypothetical protein DMG49_17150 [Acidobacteria bacterium]|nr:MAG: hypothetical protein DMG49_17150 [Acidobacteriota bacterium]
MNMKAGYWIATVLLCLLLLFSGFLDITHKPQMVSGIATIGYPEYFLTIDGTAKFLAVLALLIPGFFTLREWAYAGITFLTIGAAWSHLARQQSPLSWPWRKLLIGCGEERGPLDQRSRSAVDLVAVCFRQDGACLMLPEDEPGAWMLGGESG